MKKGSGAAILFYLRDYFTPLAMAYVAEVTTGTTPIHLQPDTATILSSKGRTLVTNIIEVEHLRKTYGQTVAVDDVSLQVNDGEIFGLLGPNDAGKTTTVESLQGLRQPNSGHLRVLGLNPQTESAKLRRRIGSQLQKSALSSRIRVWEGRSI